MKIEEEDWYNHCKLINEKTIHLNKSSTKIITYGIHPKSFEGALILSDRASGDCVDLPLKYLNDIVTGIKDILNGTKPDLYNEDAGISITRLKENIWKCYSSTTQRYIFIHETTLHQFCYVVETIDLAREISALNPPDYFNKFEELKQMTVELNAAEILSRLECEMRSTLKPGTTEGNVVLYLLCNYEYLKKFSMYKSFFSIV